MSELPGRGTGLLVAIAIGIGVVVAFFLSGGPNCDDLNCGEVEGPKAAEPVAVPGTTPPGTAPSESPGTPAPPDTPGGDGQPGPTGTRDAQGGDPAMAFGLQIDQPPIPDAASDAGSDPIAAILNSGGLRVTPQTPGTGQGRLDVDPFAGTASGRLDPLLVQDFRGSREGWTLTATMSDFTSADGHRIDAGKLAWKPFCRPAKGGTYPSRVAAGSPTTMSRTALLCSTPSMSTVTGGEFDVGADFTMRLPSTAVPAGSYSSTLLLTLT